MPFATETSPVATAIGDLDGNGDLDVVVANSGSHTVSVLPGVGGTLAAKTDFATGDTPVSLAIGDFDDDGDLDLAVANSGSRSVTVLRSNGDGTFGGRTDISVGPEPSHVATADLDGDGDLDLAVANRGDGTVTILLGDGLGGFGGRADFGVSGHPVSLAIGDLNLDGKPDIVVANQTSWVTAMLNTGTLLVGVDPGGRPSTGFELGLPRPNPSRTGFNFEVALQRAAAVRLTVHDLQGRTVASLEDGWLPAGLHTRAWDGASAAGVRVRPGVYVVRFSAPGIERARKIQLVR
jgi:hypothetical protein